jgi:signal peptidase II
MRLLLSRLRLTLPVAIILATVDCTTKELAVEFLPPVHVPHPVLGDFLRFTLSYNTQAAMSLPLGSNARPLLVVASLAVLTLLLRFLWTSQPSAKVQRVALGLILGGAVGNLLSRLQSTRGVVDFIDVGLRGQRFYIFNVADMGICCGAALFAIALWSDRSAEVDSPGGAAA